MNINPVGWSPEIPTTHIVLDLETLGTNHNAQIFEIGAIAIANGAIVGRFDKRIFLDGGINIDALTLKWWLNQGDALNSKLNKDFGLIPLNRALYEFNNFLSRFSNYVLVGNGSTFDITILESAYRSEKVITPTGFHQYRDFRTYKELFERSTNTKIAPLGSTHTAVEDAELEAKLLIVILNYFAPKRPLDIGRDVFEDQGK